MNNSISAFQNLSIKDLLDAREAFHIHLMKKQNVVGTAIGKYRRRVENNGEAKRLDNTKVNDSSYPSVLVFVKKWLTHADFQSKKTFDDYIPSKVYLPDGREIPLCVIEAPSFDANMDSVNENELVFPSDFIGGGYPLLVESQGVERLASIGCIVSDGNKYFALTNRHVTGKPGTVIYTKVKGTAIPIGKSADKFLGNIFFTKLYKDWQASNLISNVDVGLIEIDDIRFWKTDIFKIGSIGKVFDLNTTNLTLDIIGSSVKAFGSVSGLLAGEISALFYRYKSVGGLEYVTDFLIGPGDEKPTLDTKNGDSGTVWIIESNDDAGKEVNLPIAVQWGQHCFLSEGKTLKHNYALATSLANVLRELEVDIVSGWNVDSGYTWGEVGHYTIANFACEMLTNKNVKKLFAENLELITFQQNDLLTDASIKRKRKSINYTPLADVPDLVWKIRGGAYQRSLENPNHFADMDKPDSKKQKLLDLCDGSGDKMKYLTPDEWLTYYTDKSVKDSSKGILPFRVWQIFLQMVKYVSEGNTAGFIASSGILAHYVGDACQPLHISYMFNGIPSSGKGEAKKGEGVHEAFEADMINKYNKEIITAVKKLIKGSKYKVLEKVGSGKEAAAATVDLMKTTFAKIEPQKIVAAFIKYGKSSFKDSFWSDEGKSIVPELFSNGSYTLASLWNSAWELGRGDSNIKNLSAVDPEDIMNLYQDETFMPSVNIKSIASYLDL